MKSSSRLRFVVLGALLVGCASWYVVRDRSSDPGESADPAAPGELAAPGGPAGPGDLADLRGSVKGGGTSVPGGTLTSLDAPPPKAIPPFVEKAIAWLVEAQHRNGGWGAGSHARQDVRDPHAVKTDPATTAFAAMALLRAGHTPSQGDYRAAVRLATEHLCGVVEEAPAEGARITDLEGTQPQQKLGPQVDTAIAAQFFSRVLGTLPEGDDLRGRVDAALDKCLVKLQGSQHKDGSWGKGGWAPVLQSSFGCSALEFAQAAGKTVNPESLANARRYQAGNFNVRTGKALAADAAGVELYALSGSQRANAASTRAANEFIERAKKQGKLAEDAEVNTPNLEVAGVDGATAVRLYDAVSSTESQIRRLQDDSVLAGFGNNGGEEFLSYMLTSESLVITGGEPWEKWNTKMRERLAKIQSADGSWTGHHCITSPVFCTAAAVQCLTADQDAALLLRISDDEVAAAK